MAHKERKRRTLMQEIGMAFRPVTKSLRGPPRVGGQAPLAFALTSVPVGVARKTNRLRKRVRINRRR